MIPGGWLHKAYPVEELMLFAEKKSPASPADPNQNHERPVYLHVSRPVAMTCPESAAKAFKAGRKHSQERQGAHVMSTFWGSACCDEGFHLIDEQTPGHAAGGLEDSAVHMHKGIVLQSGACRRISQSQRVTSQAPVGLP